MFKTRSGIHWLMGTTLKSVFSNMERSCNFSYALYFQFLKLSDSSEALIYSISKRSRQRCL